MAAAPEVVVSAYGVILAPLIECLRRGAELAMFTGIDPETEAQSIHGVVWANVNRQWSGGMGDLHRLRDRVQRFCLRGLGVPAETIDSALAAASRAELLINNS